jgi:hypothetical protein
MTGGTPGPLEGLFLSAEDMVSQYLSAGFELTRVAFRATDRQLVLSPIRLY